MTAVRWIAGSDGIAHAHLGGERLTARGASVIGERWAWPTLTRARPGWTCRRGAEASRGSTPPRTRSTAAHTPPMTNNRPED